MRLLEWQGVAADREVEIGLQFEAAQQGRDELGRLVGDAGELETEAGEAVEAFAHTVVDARGRAVQQAIVRIEAGARRLVVRLARKPGRPRRSQRALDQHLRALADESPDGVLRQRCDVEIAEHRVGGGGQVRDGVEQRTVEVDADRVDHHRVAPAHLSRPPGRSAGGNCINCRPQ